MPFIEDMGAHRSVPNTPQLGNIPRKRKQEAERRMERISNVGAELSLCASVTGSTVPGVLTSLVLSHLISSLVGEKERHMRYLV